MHSKMTSHNDRLCGALKTLNVLLDLQAENFRVCQAALAVSENHLLQPEKK